jgi:hypothetical protein
MNKVKMIAVAAALFCAVTSANAEGDGMKIGARVGYSVQSLGDGADMGTLGVGGGLAIKIPMGPIAIAPEVAFLYRDLMTIPGVSLMGVSTPDMTFTEMAVSIPIMVQYSIVESAFLQVGVQIDIPISSEICVESTCVSADGKETSLGYNRKSFDLGIAFGAGYMVMPNLGIDARYVLGLMPAYEYEVSLLGVSSKTDFGKVSTLASIGATYYF